MSKTREPRTGAVLPWKTILLSWAVGIVITIPITTAILMVSSERSFGATLGLVVSIMPIPLVLCAALEVYRRRGQERPRRPSVIYGLSTRTYIALVTLVVVLGVVLYTILNQSIMIVVTMAALALLLAVLAVANRPNSTRLPKGYNKH